MGLKLTLKNTGYAIRMTLQPIFYSGRVRDFSKGTGVRQTDSVNGS